MIVALVGPHGAGKTSLGTRIAQRLGVPFDAELGRELAVDPTWRPDGVDASMPAGAFDHELMLRELSRDAARRGVPRVVETWHPGNLAFAARRSPAEAARWLAGVRAAVVDAQHRDEVLVLPVLAGRSTLGRRQSEPGDLDFFLEVGRAAVCWARALGLRVAPAMRTDRHDPHTLANAFVGRLPFLVPTFDRSLR